MEWHIRFLLGFPARPTDAADVLRVLPELENNAWQPPRKLYYHGFLHDDLYTSTDFAVALRRWIADVKPERSSDGKADCPSPSCPLRSGPSAASTGPELDIGGLFLKFTVVAGGPNAKLPREMFLDLVRKVHPSSDSPKEIILTDPYIYADVSEDGLEGGFRNLVDYLHALGIDSEDSFTLTTTPSPKRGTKTSRSNLQRLLKKTFKKVRYKDFSPTLVFHDRLYLVRHSSGSLRGLFGPSLNGLSSPMIVLMGELTDPQPLRRIRDWLG